MNTTNIFIYLIILFLIISILFKYAQQKEQNAEESIQDYLLNEKGIHKNKKPILWIYIPHYYNSRHWESFGSRSSFDLNQPYIYLTIQSIIQHCSDDFYICIIDNYSFEKLLPKLSFDVNEFGNPVHYNLVVLCLLNLLYKYGGMIVPASFVCFKNLLPLYEQGTRDNKIFVGENVNRNSSSLSYLFSPDISFMGAKIENPMIYDLIEYTQQMISTDYTDQSVFLGNLSKWVLNKKNIYIIPAKKLGCQTTDDSVVLIDQLLEQDYILFSPKTYGIWIPAKEILERTHYQWFARLSKKQVLQGNTILSKYILLAVAPKENVPMIKQPVEENNWISFWKVPSDAPIWGLKPIYLGNNLLRSKDS
jgi:hypothetical protein